MKIISSNNLIKPQVKCASATTFIQTSKTDAVMTKSAFQSNRGIFSPAYFHPSFGSAVPSVKQLGEFVDYAVANPHDLNYINKNLIPSFKDTILNLMESKNYIGKGRHGVVYNLSDKHVLRHEHWRYPSVDKGFKFVENRTFNNLKTWCGDTLAEIFNIRILENANPTGKAIQAGAPYEISDAGEIARIIKEIHTPKCAALPQKAFDDLAYDFNILNKFSLNPADTEACFPHFDCVNPNNLLLDTNAIKTVDEISFGGHRNKNNLTELLRPLLLTFQPNQFVLPSQSLIEPRRQILKKCLLANEVVKLPMPHEDVNLLRYSFDLVGLEDKWHLVENKISELRKKVPENNERTWQLEKYFNQL